jgi:hypothetical protein
MDGQQNLVHLSPGDRIHLTPVDPWDLVTALGSGPFEGTVTAVDESNHDAMVFRLDQPLTYEGITAKWFMAFARHFGKNFAAGPTAVPSNIRSISEEEAKLGIAVPTSDQRRLSMIGDVEWASSND